MTGNGMLLMAAAAFLGSHFALSHPLRAPIVRRIGEGGFALVYSVVAFATLGWTALAYRAAPAGPPWWPVDDGLWFAATLVMLLASVLLTGSLIRNPALPGARVSTSAQPRGVYAITRHPMMWSFALWSVVHLAVVPGMASLILTAAILTLALVGARFQDAKKDRLQPGWREWRARTAFTPFMAQLTGHAGWRATWPGWGVLAAGVLLWLIATWAHGPLAGWPAGIWRWVSP